MTETKTHPVQTRKPRTRKAQSADQLMTAIAGQPLAVKVSLLKLLEASIQQDGAALKEQLALISGLK